MFKLRLSRQKEVTATGPFLPSAFTVSNHHSINDHNTHNILQMTITLTVFRKLSRPTSQQIPITNRINQLAGHGADTDLAYFAEYLLNG